VYDGELAILAPFGQSGEDFVKDYYAWHDRRGGEMSGQAGMISGDGAANCKVHAWKFQPSHPIHQLCKAVR
jgi:hypothetical protein